MRSFHLVWSSLGRRKARTALTLLSILVAFVLFSLLSAIALALSQGVDVAGADRIIVRHRVSIIQMLPQSYQARIARIAGVRAVTHATWFGGIYQRPENFFPQFPVEPAAYLEMYPEYLLPEAQRSAWLSTRTGAIAGRATAERFGWKVGDRIPIQATIWTQKDGRETWEFDLVGIFDGAEKGTDTTPFLFHYDYFDEARAFGQGLVGWYLVRIEDPDRAAEVARAIDDEFANSPAEVKAEAEKAFLQGFAAQVGNIGAILVAVLSAVFFTILLVAGNTMSQSVRERTRELGVLKALGFSDGRVLALVLAESTLLAGLGGVAGLGIGWLLVARGDPTGSYLPTFYFAPRDVAIGLALIAVLGVATGLFPALAALRLKVAEALRRE